MAGGIEKGTDDARAEVGIFEFYVGSFDGKRRSVTFNQFLANRARAEAGDVFGCGLGEREHWSDAMGCVPHGRQTRPVIRPSIHVLLMAGLKKLDLSQLAFLIHLLDEQKLARIHDCFHHHVFLLCLSDEIHNLFAIGDTRRHRHGASGMFAGFERRDRLPGVIGNGGVDVDQIHVWIL